MKTLDEKKEEYEDLMAHSRAAKQKGDYEAAEMFFNMAHEVMNKEDDEE